uniref:Protein kinase domain-containing protein n=1 Tax=Arcella intermedia TaxID=1963864 RepID=A0A6B2L036_9EUKA
MGVPVIKQNELHLDRIIGEGQYGKVWEGRCRGEVVAVKVLNDLEWDDAIIVKFEKEVEIMSQLHHPNVVLLMGACTETRSSLVIVTELCEGNLRGIIHDKKIILSMLQKLNFAIDIAQGMAWLHNTKPHQIIHRDLKLTNLLVDSNWKVKVCDFGLSDFLKTDFLQDEGVAVGSALWMSPEVLEGRKLTEKIDVYSFGLILWEIIKRVQPYGEYETVAALRKAVCKDGVRPPISKKIPPVLGNIIEQCWQQDPQKRPSFVSVLDMLKDSMVEIFLTPVCPDTAKLWRMEKSWAGKEQIKFDSFSRAVCKYLRIKQQEKALAFRCLQALLAVEKKKGADSTPMVSIARLGLVMAWFGPMTALSWEKPKVTFLDRIVAVLKHSWFFGDIEREESDALLRDFKKKPGTFLVRLNLGGSTEPFVSPFTISKVNNTQKFEHMRVYHYKDRTGYFIQVNTKTGLSQLYSRGPIDKLISKLKLKGLLRTSGGVPGQKYKSLFESGTEDDVSIYLQLDRDDEPFDDDDSGDQDLLEPED